MLMLILYYVNVATRFSHLYLSMASQAVKPPDYRPAWSTAKSSWNFCLQYTEMAMRCQLALHELAAVLVFNDERQWGARETTMFVILWQHKDQAERKPLIHEVHCVASFVCFYTNAHHSHRSLCRPVSINTTKKRHGHNGPNAPSLGSMHVMSSRDQKMHETSLPLSSLQHIHRSLLIPIFHPPISIPISTRFASGPDSSHTHPSTHLCPRIA